MPEIVQSEYLNWILVFLIYLVAAMLMLGLGKVVFKYTQRSVNIDHEMTGRDNLAYAFLYVGYFAGLLLAVGSAIVGPSQGLWADLQALGLYSTLAIVLLNISRKVTDRILLRHFSLRKEVLDDRNTGVGIVEGANYFSAGLILFGAVSGESGSLAQGLLTAVAYWLLGQVLLLITGMLYQRSLSYDVHEELEKDNVAVGIGFAGALIAIANLIRHGLMGDFDTWSDTLIEVGFEAGIGLISIPLVRLATDRILLPGHKLTEEIVGQEKPNIGAALVEATAYIGGSVLITWCI